MGLRISGLGRLREKGRAMWASESGAQSRRHSDVCLCFKVLGSL